jgi:hypothetical protein
MTIILVAPVIEQRLKDINDTLKNIQSIMADDFSAEDTSVLSMTETVKEAEQNLPQPGQPTTN